MNEGTGSALDIAEVRLSVRGRSRMGEKVRVRCARHCVLWFSDVSIRFRPWAEDEAA